ncbi:MAG: hypothetical protein JWQ87_531 [Candidatus Sulfotelmatobacter sp.]|nr:hypothetical protein [Candidatus Sulfotelmatobacter sp.]
MTEHDQENWVALYRAALVELEHEKIAGRIKVARTEIVARVGKLQNMPGLHADERQAIADALSSLRFLELEESRQNKEGSTTRTVLKTQNKENKG